MHPYRTHNCGQLRAADVGQQVRLSGWVHRKRDHGQLLFIDLRDHYGITQVVFQPEDAFFSEAEGVRLESVLTVIHFRPMPSARVISRSSGCGRSAHKARTSVDPLTFNSCPGDAPASIIAALVSIIPASIGVPCRRPKSRPACGVITPPI